tara:strand:+ start:619 stop:2274 length:1656 start_codon:yes stop_codon:yes gene_type:complete
MPVFVGAGTSSFMKGDGGVGVSTVTTTERDALSGVKKGQFIFNETLNLAQYYDGTGWKSIDAPPVINNFSLDGGSAGTTGIINATAGGNATIAINGSFFDQTAAVVTFEGSGETLNTASIVRNSTNLLTVTVARSGFDNTNEPYSIKVLNSSGLSATLSDALTQDTPPAFSTNANTNIGTLYEGTTNYANLTTVVATDPDGDTVTHTISAGALPSGVSLNTNGTFTGTVGSSQAGNFTFTVQAATSNYNVTRQFIVTVATLPQGGTVSTSGNNRIHTFTSSGTFTTAFNAGVELLVVGGGGGGAGAFAGGGGAGGMVHDPSGATMTSGSYTITVGQGGQGGLGWQAVNGMRGNNGGDSVAFSLTGKGGGGGGSFDYTYNGSANANQIAQIGGCGGGGAAVQGSMADSARFGAASNQGNFSGATSYGTGGGNGQSAAQLSNYHGGGGGGASQAGINASSQAGDGGDGQAISISGSSITYAGGGGGSNQGGTRGLGGNGGGGNATNTSNPAQGGTDGLGGGGGAAGYNGSSNARLGGSGGNGVVIIKYDKNNL